MTATEVAALQSKVRTQITSRENYCCNSTEINITIARSDIVRADISEQIWEEHRRLSSTGRLSDKVAAIAILINAIERFK